MSLINTLFSEAVKILPANAAFGTAIAATTLYPASGSFISVRGLHRFAFFIRAGGLNSALTCQVQQAAAIDGTPKDITGAVKVVPADGDDKYYIIEVGCDRLDTNNGYDFVSLYVTGAAGSDDFLDITFLGFGDKQPVTQSSDVATPVNVVG